MLIRIGNCSNLKIVNKSSDNEANLKCGGATATKQYTSRKKLKKD
jgi:hypothetical protein